MSSQAAGATAVSPSPDTEPGTADEARFGEQAPDPSPARPNAFAERVRQGLRGAACKVRANPISTLLLAVPVVIYAVGAWVHRYVTEDGFINFHIVQQISAGNGPVFNGGERVEAYTSPLWLLVLTLLRTLFGRFLPLQNLAVIAGLGLSVLALLFVMLGSTRLARIAGPLSLRRRDDGESSVAEARPPILVPAGALVFACAPFMWRWATSGLETSLSFAWIAFCFWGLVRRYGRSVDAGSPLRPDRPRWLLVAIGLGPLVRPEFAVYTLCYFGAVWLTSTDWWKREQWKRLAISFAWMAAIPFAYQIFRMGYFAALLPNTALAKNSDASLWTRGMDYLQDFLKRETMWVGFVALFALLALTAGRALRSDRKLFVLYMAPLAGAALNVLFVQRVGGDYMYARFYVPAFVAILAPVAVIALPRPSGGLRVNVPLVATAAAVLVVVLWSVGGMVNGKILDANTGLVFGDYGMLLPGQTNPVNPQDYGFLFIAMDDQVLKRWGARDNVLFDSTEPKNPIVQLRPGQGIVVKAGAIGVTSYVAGPDVWIVDDRGLADAVAGRLVDNTVFPIPGHEKLLPWEYVVARWAPPSPNDNAKVRSVRHAFECDGDAKELVAATTEPMTPARFFKNIVDSRKLTSLRISADAQKFEEAACAGR